MWVVLPLACCSGGAQCPACSVMIESEDRQPGPVDGCGARVEVGGDAGQPAGAGFAAAPGPAGEVGDLAFHGGPVRLVALLPGQVALLVAGSLENGFLGVDGDGPPAPRGGAGRPQRAGGAPGPERCLAAAVAGGDDDGGLPGRAGDGGVVQVHG